MNTIINFVGVVSKIFEKLLIFTGYGLTFIYLFYALCEILGTDIGAVLFLGNTGGFELTGFQTFLIKSKSSHTLTSHNEIDSKILPKQDFDKSNKYVT